MNLAELKKKLYINSQMILGISLENEVLQVLIKQMEVNNEHNEDNKIY
jgi:hypothetical protein